MNDNAMERQLRRDARAVQFDCPDNARRRALWRIEQMDQRARHAPPRRWPWLASACALLVAVAITWVLIPDTGHETAAPAVAQQADLHFPPLMADPDRLLARREAALEEERQSLARDLQALRDHVTASFESKSNG